MNFSISLARALTLATLRMEVTTHMETVLNREIIRKIFIALCLNFGLLHA
jgi:hypothetical protein